MSDRKHEFEIEIAAPVEQVWKTISEGEGLTRWFAPNARVTPGEKGSVWLSWGPGMEGEAPINIWEPGKRLQTQEGAKTVDYILEAKGGSTVLRLVHSGFGADASFDDEYESTFGGWRTFLAMLKFGLERHAGAPHANVTIFHFLDLPVDAAWPRLAAHLKLSNSSREGEPYTAQFEGEELRGTVVAAPKPRYVCLSVEGWNDALLGLFVEKCGGKCGLTVMSILFGDRAAQADAYRTAWSGALDRVFPEAATAGAS